MKHRLLAAAVLGALAVPGPVFAGGRHFKLEAHHEPGTVRFLSNLHVTLESGKTTSWVTVTRTGTFSDPRYGQFEITRQMLLAMVENFNKRVFGQDVFIDVAHRPSDGAAGKVVKLAVEGDRLRAQVEWTPYGVEAVKEKGYAYLSAEYHEDWQNNEGGGKCGPVLLGAALTVRPVIKRLDPVQLSEEDDAPPRLLHPELRIKLLEEVTIMWKELLKKLSETLKLTKLADTVVEQLVATAEKALGSVTDKTAAEALIAGFEATGKKLAEQIGDKVVTLSIDLPSMGTMGLTEAQVLKLMEDRAKKTADDAKTLAETLTARQKLLADTIAKAEGLPDALKKELTEGVRDLVTAEMTEAQVLKLAAAQIASGNRINAAQSLSNMGFIRPGGTAHISVDDSNVFKKLQDAVDRRLGFEGLADVRRYSATGGKLQDVNKDLVTKVLAQFDAENGRRLHEEGKRLAGGDGIVSDVAVPAIFERTVIREALSSLVGLQFVDVGTLAFSGTATIPYSYRDTTAASRSSTRVYEGGSIARAGVKQTADTAYPTPQKLAFEVTDELRYLTANGQLDWDAVVENVRNASRIVGEDSEKLIFDEVLNAADQYAVTAVATEALTAADGTLTVFVLDHFPVVRPKKIYDLQGNQVGSTLYPIVIKTNSVARTEWDGTGTQAAGLYWTMDYNLGEVHFVDEAGDPSPPTNGHAVEATSYSYTTNVYAFDTDEGADETDVHWNAFLYRYGLRKSVIEDTRFHMANFGLMSGTAMTSIEQAKQFAANYRRPGTDLSGEGNLGVIKGVPNFKTTAPGLNIGDNRIVLGERAQTRFRMMKPWAMGQLQDQRDSNGRFTGKKEAYGDQFIVLHTPTPLKAATTSLVLYSASARVDRA